MRAIVIEAPKQVSVKELESPVPGSGEVLVRSRAAGLCRTDIEMMTGEFTDPRWVRYPVIPGHEWSGVVAEIGPDVESVRAGDRVVCEGFITCGECPPCRRGETHWCERIDALGFTRPGGYAELVAVPQQVVHRLPEHVSFDAGVLIEPASVVLHALERARLEPGEAVGVIGVGTLGSTAIALAKALYAPSRIVAYGVREEELKLARRLGATETEMVHADDRGAGAVPADLDLVVETAGVSDAVVLATELCRPGGRAVLLGIAGAGRTLTLPSDVFVGKEIALIGSIGYPADVWARVVRLVADGAVELDPIVTHHYPVSEFEEAVRLMDDRRGIVAKIVLEHA
jgi:2-desacetyl-2-hydroxyethyl bacteriochlorophyllide A dehydrogenase